MALFRAAKIFICTTLVLYCPNAGNIFSEKKDHFSSLVLKRTKSLIKDLYGSSDAGDGFWKIWSHNLLWRLRRFFGLENLIRALEVPFSVLKHLLRRKWYIYMIDNRYPQNG